MSVDRIEEIKEEGGAEEKPQILAMRYIPRNEVEAKLALNIIKPYVEELAAKSGEYSFANIIGGVLSGAFVLYLGYMVKTEQEKEIIEHLGTSLKDVEAIKKDFAGYIIVEPNYAMRSVHVWQAYVMQQYENTTLLSVGMKWLERKLIDEYDMKGMTMASPLKGWHKIAIGLGFRELYTITAYRKDFAENPRNNEGLVQALKE